MPQDSSRPWRQIHIPAARPVSPQPWRCNAPRPTTAPPLKNGPLADRPLNSPPQGSGNCGEPTLQRLGRAPAVTQAEVPVSHLKPVPGPDVGAMGLQQTPVERSCPAGGLGLHARKADHSSSRTNPLQHLFALNPLSHALAPAAHFCKRRGQKLLTPAQDLLSDPFIHYAATDVDLFLCRQEKLAQRLILGNEPADAEPRNAVSL